MAEHRCSYSHCLHPGEKVEDSAAVIVNGRYYHWDCAQTRNELQEIRDIYLMKIDSNVHIPVLAKVINDLVFKYNQPIEYVRFGVKYYADHKTYIKSPFTLLYLRSNKIMKQKYEEAKTKEVAL